MSQRTMVLTGASRGIGHATVQRFSNEGWRVLTCSRHAFPNECPWHVHHVLTPDAMLSASQVMMCGTCKASLWT